MNKQWIFILLLLFVFSSCKKRPISDAQKTEELLLNDLNFEQFSSKAKMKYNDGQQEVSSALNIRIRKDSVIWMSITPALGIEMARVLIRKDSIFFTNKIKKEYYAGSFEYINQAFGFDVNYKMLENMLLGNIPLKNTENTKLFREENNYILQQNMNDYEVNNIIGIDEKRLKNINVTDKEKTFNAELSYLNFEKLGDILFGNLIEMNLTQKEQKVKIQLEYNKTNLDDQSLTFPFSIPSHYERIQAN